MSGTCDIALFVNECAEQSPRGSQTVAPFLPVNLVGGSRESHTFALTTHFYVLIDLLYSDLSILCPDRSLLWPDRLHLCPDRLLLCPDCSSENFKILIFHFECKKLALKIHNTVLFVKPYGKVLLTRLAAEIFSLKYLIFI